MAYQTGTATNYKDVLAKLRTFATANGWTAKKWSNPASGEHELVLFSNGDAGNESIHVGYQTYTNDANDTFNIKVWSAVSYVTGTDFDSVAGKSPDRCVGAWNAAMTYHFVVTKQSIMMVLRVSTSFHYAYLGHIRPYTSRGHWPSPLCVAASCSSNLRWSDTSNQTGSIQRPRSDNYVMVRNDAGNWVEVKTMFPITSGGPVYDSGDYPSGNKIMQKYIWFDVECYGEPEGIYYIQGANIQPGQILTEGSTNYLVCPEVFRTGLNDYFAVRLA